MLKLKQFVTISAGYPFRGKIMEKNDSQIRAVQMKDVSMTTGINWETCVKTKLHSENKFRRWLKSGDILFVARGNCYYATLVDQIADQINAVASPHFFILRCQSKQIFPDYLAWFLNQTSCQQYYQREAEGSLTRSIRRNVLENTPVIVPSLTKQCNIILLAELIKQQQKTLTQLINHGNIMMNKIASNLFKEQKND